VNFMTIAFVAIVLGGMRNVLGAIARGPLIAVSQQLTAAYIGSPLAADALSTRIAPMGAAISARAGKRLNHCRSGRVAGATDGDVIAALRGVPRCPRQVSAAR
jgi:hypothetical protein